MLAAVVAVLSPLRDILSRDPLAAIAPERERRGRASRRRPRQLALGGRACLAAATAILLAAPNAAVLGMVFLVARAAAACCRSPLDADARARAAARAEITGAVPHVAVMELRAARARAIGDRRDRRDRGVRRVAIQGAHARPAARPGKRRARHERVHRRVGLAGRLLQPAAGPRRSRPSAAGEARTPAGRARGARLPRRAAGLGRAAHVGDRPAARADAAAARQPDRGRESARRRQRGCAPAAGRCSRRRSPTNTICTSATPFTLPTPDPDDRPGGGARRRTSAGRRGDHHERRRIRARVGESRTRAPTTCCSTPASRRRRRRREIERGARARRSGLAVQTAEAHAAEQNALSRQGLERLTQIATLILVVAVLAMAAAIGEHGLAAPPAAGEAEARGVPAQGAVAHDPAGERAAARGRLRRAARCSASTASSCWTARWRT